MKKVFIHGLGQTAASWDKTVSVMKSCSDTACPELAELLRGRTVNYTNLYKAFAEYCDGLDGPLDLCGLSLGGVLALDYALKHQERVRSLVLIGTQYKMPAKLLTFQNAVFRFMPNAMFEQMGFGKKEFIELSRSMMTLDFRSLLEKAECPVLILCGEKDKANRKAAEALSRILKDARLQIVAGAGHEVNTEAPEKLAKVLEEFYEARS